MNQTARHALPLIASEQAQKHVTHNEALLLVDAVLHLSLAGIGAVSPPAEPAPGGTYALGESPDGAWSGRGGAIAAWTQGGWRFSVPGEGWIGWDEGEGRVVIHRHGQWTPLLDDVAAVGIGTDADPVNRLAVRSEAALFTGVPAGAGGNGNVRLTLNRDGASASATVIFQSDWSGRAEIGLSGNDDFAFKVSPDGSAFTTAMTISAAQGFVTFNAMAGSAVGFPTVSGNTLTVTTSHAVPAPQSGTAATIDTIAGGFDGALLIVTGTAGVTLTFRDNSGNLKLGANRVLDAFEDSLMLVRRGTDWIELSYADNG